EGEIGAAVVRRRGIGEAVAVDVSGRDVEGPVPRRETRALSEPARAVAGGGRQGGLARVADLPGGVREHEAELPGPVEVRDVHDERRGSRGDPGTGAKAAASVPLQDGHDAGVVRRRDEVAPAVAVQVAGDDVAVRLAPGLDGSARRGEAAVA